MRLKDKVVLISGGAGGIGLATARRMIQEGAKVVLSDLADGEQAAADIGAAWHRHDVTVEAEWERLAAWTLEAHGRIDVLVNAAGIEGRLDDGTPLGSFAEWRRVMAINLDGTFLGIRAVLPTMLAQGTGSIVNLSSLASYIGTPFTTAYGASKAGVWHLSRTTASFAAMQGARVRCNSVHPGLIRTRMTDQILDSVAMLQGVDRETVEAEQLRWVPFAARGEPTDVADIIVYLASDESAYVTGSEFKVDGGWSIGNPR